jgi:hypothetical protein
MKELGPIEAFDGTGCGSTGYRGSYEEACRNLKIAGAEVGADDVQIMSISEPGAIHLDGPTGRRSACEDNRFVIRGTASAALGQ